MSAVGMSALDVRRVGLLLVIAGAVVCGGLGVALAVGGDCECARPLPKATASCKACEGAPSPLPKAPSAPRCCVRCGDSCACPDCTCRPVVKLDRAVRVQVRRGARVARWLLWGPRS